MKDRDAESVFQTLAGLTPRACPDPRERAQRVATELRRRLAERGIDEAELSGPASVTVRAVGASYNRYSEVEGVLVGILPDAEPRLSLEYPAGQIYVKVGEWDPVRIKEGAYGINFNSCLEAIYRVLPKAREQRRDDALRAATAKRIEQIDRPTLRQFARVDPLARGGRATFRLTLDVYSEDEVRAVAAAVRALRGKGPT